MTKIVINKVEAGKEMIDTAINLITTESFASMCVLAGAAHRLLSDLVENSENGKGKSTCKIYYDAYNETVPDQQKMNKKEFFFEVNKTYNFFRHGDQDHSEKIELYIYETEWHLFFAIRDYLTLGELPTDRMKRFLRYFHEMYGDSTQIDHFDQIDRNKWEKLREEYFAMQY